MMAGASIEREIKLDVPGVWTRWDVEALVDTLAEALGASVKRAWQVRRVFTYYDTEQRDLLRRGACLRTVEGFDPAGNDGRAAFRHDYKEGNVGTPQRTELSRWSDAPDLPAELIDRACRGGGLDVPVVAARCLTTHDKWFLSGPDGTWEVSWDHFASPDGAWSFGELEVEIGSGNGTLGELRALPALAALEQVGVQKYARVMQQLAAMQGGGRK